MSETNVQKPKVKRLRGFIVSRNTAKNSGIILSEGKPYCYFEGESRGFNFNHFGGKKIAVTFTVSASKRLGAFPLARNIESDREFYEAKFKAKYGAKYHTPEERRAYQDSKTSTDVPVEEDDFRRKQRQERMVEQLPAGTADKEELLKQRYGSNYRAPSQRYTTWAEPAKNSTVPVSH